MGIDGINTYGVWFGKNVPENDFDEIITAVPEPIQEALSNADIPDVRVLSDIVRIYAAMDRPGWVYHDFDCKVKSLPEFEFLTPEFARYGKHQIDHFLFYTGSGELFKELFGWFMLRGMRGGKMVFAYSDLHHILNEKYLGRVGVIEKEHFTHGN